MAEYTVSVEANRPIDHAWAVLVDDSRMGEWLQGYKSTETLEGEPLTIGSKHRVVFDEGGM
ncbi:MAG: SRPBCC family protein [Chloroflexi bacterium]|nr:SRPBCC family protein [Chloroflexota bacterium]